MSAAGGDAPTPAPRRHDRPRASSSAPTGASAAIRWPMRAPPRRDARLPAHRRPRAAPVDAQVVDHADPGHAARSRWRCGRTASTCRQLATAWNTDPHRPLPLEHGASSRSARGSVQIVVATTAGFALSVLRPRVRGLLTGARPRDAVRAADRAARAALPDDRRRAARALAADRLRTGRSGCRPARARSTSSS